MKHLHLPRWPGRALSAMAALLVSACLAGDRSPTGPSLAISDANHSGGTPGFYFLPPMVPQPAVTGLLDDEITAISPVIALCDVTSGPDVNCGGTAPGSTPAVLTFGISTSPAITLDGDKFRVNWDTRQPGFDAGRTYRLHVIAGVSGARRDLGFADVLLTSEPGKAKALATGDVIVLNDGRTLPIQFRIERGVLPRPDLACDADRVRVLINVLYPATGRTAALAGFDAILADVANGDLQGAVAAMFEFLKQLLSLYGSGGLLDPTAQLGISIGQATGELGSELYQCAGAPEASPVDLGTTLSSGGTAQVIEPSSDPEPQVVLTSDHRAAASFPAGAVDQTVLATITPDPDGVLPFPTRLTQFPPFFDFSTFPEVLQFGEKVTVGICVSDEGVPVGRFPFLQVAHPDPAANRQTIEILTKVPAPPGVCAPVIGFSPVRGWMGTLDRLAQRAFDALSPQPLQAALLEFGGIGGQTSSFSPFRVVDPLSRLAFTAQPSNAQAGATIVPPVQVTVLSNEDVVIKSFAGSVTLSITPGTGTPEATLSGTLTRPVVDGVATFDDLSIDLAGTGYTLTAAPNSETDPLPANGTSTSFDISASDPVDGVLSPGEWDDAQSFGPYPVALPGDRTTSATLLIRNGVSRCCNELFMAVQFKDDLSGEASVIISVSLDENANGEWDIGDTGGEDGIVVQQRVNGEREDQFFDLFFSCDVDPCQGQGDAEWGSTNDGRAASTDGTGPTVIELAHQTNNEDSRDAFLQSGQDVPLFLSIGVGPVGALVTTQIPVPGIPAPVYQVP